MGVRRAGLGPILMVVAAAVFAPSASADQATGKAAGLPPWASVEKVLGEYFASLPNHKPDDLIVRSEAVEALRRVGQLGWRVSDAGKILAAVPADNEFLARALRGPAARKFMDSISRYPDAYDRLDRLSKLPRGEQTIRDLIRGPDGYKMIQYMTTAPGGLALGRQLSRSPGGTDFNQPTDRIYTARMLQQRLQRSYQEAVGSPQPSGAAR